MNRTTSVASLLAGRKLDKTMAQRVGRRVSSATRAYLRVDVRHVLFDRAHAQDEFRRNLRIALALRDQAEDFCFALGQSAER